jgi:hypothetical protein
MSPVNTSVNHTSNNKHRVLTNTRNVYADADESNNLTSYVNLVRASPRVEASGYRFQAAGKRETCCLTPETLTPLRFMYDKFFVRKVNCVYGVFG